MKLRLESDDVLYLIQELAVSYHSKAGGLSTLDIALQCAHNAVERYLKERIEFVVEANRNDN